VSVLSGDRRRLLERAVVEGRVVAEGAAVGVLSRLGVGLRDAPGPLTGAERSLRVALRARARQLGDPLERVDDPDADVWVRCPLLLGEVAYEQWHRLLFARFLELNGLLRHPEFGVAVSLEQCEELAADLGEPDGWSVAARFAAEIVPGIFRPLDPSVAVRLPREDLLALERVVTGLPADVFVAEDALGWVYQFWQSKAKDAVNASGRKIGGADLAPVTQLFTEDYMVRFLLENSLGAWWAGKHPDSPLLEGFEYLRFGEDGTPAAGTFEGWPEAVADVSVMDPCCGSGHFLVAAFGMLWRMRAEAEGLEPAAAQDAVLRDNLFGLELDPRCTQIAMFALALEAWKQGGFRQIPTPQVACSGIPAKAPLAEWTKLAERDPMLEAALTRLHALFADADTLGSLIDPVRAAEQAGLESVDWHDIAPLLDKALTAEASHSGDPAAEVFGEAAAGIARAADYLSRSYTLVATNPPYLGSNRQEVSLSEHLTNYFVESKWDLATAMLSRCVTLLQPGGATTTVSPNAWTSLRSYRDFRRSMLARCRLALTVRLGSRAFETIGGEVVQVVLGVFVRSKPLFEDSATVMDLSAESSVEAKASALRSGLLAHVAQRTMRESPDSRVAFSFVTLGETLADYADSYWGLGTGDGPRFGREFWEVKGIPNDRWFYFQGTFVGTRPFAGRDQIVLWEDGAGQLRQLAEELRDRLKNIWRRGAHAWGRSGVAINQAGNLDATLYCGDIFQNGVAAVVPRDPTDLPAIWAYMRNEEYRLAVRRLDSKVAVTNRTLIQVPFDVERWRAVAAEEFPDGLPEPWSDDATQWLFRGRPCGARQPLQVAVARLVGFAWPDQEPDAVDPLTDADGIVCLPPVAGEQPAAERVRAVLAASYGDAWSSSKLDELLVDAGGTPGDLAGWLANVFFKDHCKVFGNRPFVWHVRDGLKDGFSALVNYHKLDKATLERLTYRTLGWWIDRQKAEVEANVAGAESRLVAAVNLQKKLQLILAGEPPYDIYVRWKSLAEQPIGWDPDLDDGVRLNIRPFVEAGVLRSRFTIHWKKDRGTNPDGSERHNDLHYTTARKQHARGANH
jgi:hypothetical protein